jgi:cell division protein FtsW
MNPLGRTDYSVVGKWWWTVDRWSLAAVTALMGIGAWLITAASPAVAEHIGATHFHFIRRHFIFLLPAIILMIAVSLLSPRSVRRLASFSFVIALILMIMTLIFGSEIKGATRWINLAGLTIQPSEFAKPTFAVVTAWMFSEKHKNPNFPGNLLSFCFYIIVAILLLLQPDVGMTLVISSIWIVEFFIAGLPIIWVGISLLTGFCGLIAAYFTFSHVAARVDRFLDPSAGEGYQVATSLEAFHNGGLFGRGPGEGRVKAILPDAHTDFIMAVAGEEFGLWLCLLVLILFAFIVLRGISRILPEKNLFILMAASGLLVQFGLQAIINLASTLHMMPTKGMTLPFISYGGSSTMALSLGIGMVLALTRTRFEEEDEL